MEHISSSTRALPLLKLFNLELIHTAPKDTPCSV
jgi:hypothetical protein